MFRLLLSESTIWRSAPFGRIASSDSLITWLKWLRPTKFSLFCMECPPYWTTSSNLTKLTTRRSSLLSATHTPFWIRSSMLWPFLWPILLKRKSWYPRLSSCTISRPATPFSRIFNQSSKLFSEHGHYRKSTSGSQLMNFRKLESNPSIFRGLGSTIRC